MNKKTSVAMFGLLCLLGLWLLVGCSKKEETNEAPASAPASTAAPAPAATPIDPSTVASVSGTVKFDGAAPKASKIDMSQDAACKGTNTAETVVVDGGDVANVFVYVKDGLGDRTFAGSHPGGHDRPARLQIPSSRARCDDRAEH